MIGRVSIPSVTISCDSGGSGLLKTAMKCSCLLDFTSLSFLRTGPFLSVCFGLSLHKLCFGYVVKCLHVSFTGFCFSCKFFKPLFLISLHTLFHISVFVLLPQFIFVPIWFVRLHVYYFSKLFFRRQLSSYLHLSFLNWFDFFLGPMMHSAVSLYTCS